MSKVTFGTDGWRAVIADDFTFANVRAVAAALAEYCKATKPGAPVVVAYDARFMSDGFAAESAAQLAEQGVNVVLSRGITPTPTLAHGVVEREAAAGLMITASHNPARYNGMKIKGPYGGSATPGIMAGLERAFNRLSAGPLSESGRHELEEFIDRGEVVVEELRNSYLEAATDFLDAEVLGSRPLRVLVDPLYGAGQGYLPDLLGRFGCKVDEIHSRYLPTFGGLNPEPIDANLTELKREVVRGGYDLGLALDGDADRLGAVSERGDYIDPHRIFAVLLRYLVRDRHLRGKVVKTVSTTNMIDSLAAEYGLPLVETPIGFKYICEQILADDVLIGGEESGGIFVKGRVPERDGILTGALFLEAIVSSGKGADGVIRELMTDLGPHYYDRLDVEISEEQREAIVTAVPTCRPSQIDGRAVEAVDTKDGTKFLLADGSWLILRPSGTEPVVRVYAEAASPDSVAGLIRSGMGLVRSACQDLEVDAQ